MIAGHSRQAKAALPRLLGTVAIVTCLAYAPASLALEDAEIRGKQIYIEGTSPRGGAINAIVGEEASLLPAAAIPCTNCHGYDGLGRPEGGVVPTDVRWSQLIKTYGHVHENGRRHPAFDDNSVARSITAGIDPAANQLDRSMPIYQMSEEDLDDLVAYMKILEYDLDPGVEQDRVRVASLLPLQGSSGTLGQAMEQVLRAHFADVNEQGGVFGRQIELVSVALGETSAESLENLQQAFDSRGIFALVGGYTIGLDDELLDMLRYENVPLVGPFTLNPGDELLDSAAFYLYSGFDEQVRVLADRAFEDVGEPERTLVASPGSGPQAGLVSAVEDQFRHLGGEAPRTVTYVPGGGDAEALAERVRSNDTGAVIFLGGQDDLDALLNALAERELAPRVYVLSSFLSRPLLDAPAAFDQRLYVAYPTHTSDITPQGRADYQDLAKRHDLPTGHIQAQIAAYAAAQVFVEGLRRAGRDLARTRIVEGIEELYTFQTGLTPPLTYGPNRRIGARGAHVLVVDLENGRYAPVGAGWYDVR